ncbi:MAG: hypothetical protein JEZ12_03215 [Desulfobacterium sp.]|nr:hypothetical protein [Desulfobacterium sp.]
MGYRKGVVLRLSKAGVEQLKKRLVNPEENMNKNQVKKIRRLLDHPYYQSRVRRHLFDICVKAKKKLFKTT